MPVWKMTRTSHILHWSAASVNQKLLQNPYLQVSQAMKWKVPEKKRRFRFYAAIVSAAVVMVTAFTALTGFYLKYQETLNGGFIAKNDTIIVCPEDMTTEEFKEFLNQTTGSNWGKDKK